MNTLKKLPKVVVSSKTFWNFVKSFLMNADLRKMKMSLLKMVKPYFKRMLFLRASEAVVHRCSSKYVFLKGSQISQENACVGVSFDKVTGLKARKFIKKRPQHRCFLVSIAENF